MDDVTTLAIATSSILRSAYLFHLASDNKDYPLTYVSDSISSTFQVVSCPHETGCTGNRLGVLCHKGQQFPEHLVVQVVHQVILCSDFLCGFGIPIYESVQAATKHIYRLLRHARNINQRLEQRLVTHQDIDFGNALGIIAHAFQFAAYFKEGSQQTQVLGHRLLRGNELDTLLLNLNPLIVNKLIINKIRDLFSEPVILMIIKRAYQTLENDSIFLKYIKITNLYIYLYEVEKKSIDIEMEIITNAFRNYVYIFIFKKEP